MQGAETSRAWKFFVALVHYPVYNRTGEVVATAITNLDVHDLARAALTYGGEAVFMVTPLERQRWLLDRIIQHWKVGYGAQSHPNRKEALSKVMALGSLEEAVSEIHELCGESPLVVGTTAKVWPGATSYQELREKVQGGGVYLILFGTGWGLTSETLESCSLVLEPIFGVGSYNHLSVRSAAAVILDRVFGRY